MRNRNLGFDDREKLSFSERDRLRKDRAAGHERPRGRAAQEESRRDTQNALEAADAIFSAERGGEAGDELGDAIRAAHGTPELAEACHVFVTAVGLPKSVDLLQIFIDTADPSLVVPALEALLALKEAGDLDPSAGLKSQLRTLAQDPDDDVAGLSEDLLA
jgi:hypothetical protein